MTSQILSGSSNPNYTNNTGQNVRIVINYMYSDTNDEITINWSGVSVSESGVEAIGKNIASASGWYGDYFLLPWSQWNWWWKRNYLDTNPRTALSTQNVAIKLPTLQTEIPKRRRGWLWWVRENASEYSGFSISIALPLEIFLAPNQSFSAVCGPYNIAVIPEAG